MTTPQPGTRVLAEIVGIDRKVTQEMVLVERILDQETLLVRVESSLSTPASIRGARLPIATAALVACRNHHCVVGRGHDGDHVDRYGQSWTPAR